MFLKQWQRLWRNFPIKAPQGQGHVRISKYANNILTASVQSSRAHCRGDVHVIHHIYRIYSKSEWRFSGIGINCVLYLNINLNMVSGVAHYQNKRHSLTRNTSKRSNIFMGSLTSVLQCVCFFFVLNRAHCAHNVRNVNEARSFLRLVYPPWNSYWVSEHTRFCVYCLQFWWGLWLDP